MRWARLILFCILAALVTSGCSSGPGRSGPHSRGPGSPDTPQSTVSPAPGLVFNLSEGTPGGGGTPSPPTESKPLSEGEVKKLTARLPAQKKVPGLKQEFALRESSLPAPRAGRVEKQPFPPPVPPERAPEVESGPLKVLRHAPEGAVEQVPQLSVTFSQPMVAVTSHADTLAKGVPVRLAPEVDGNWRWVGSKTLLFEPRGLVSEGHELHRFPMATEYTVEVPAGTPSATGNKLAAAERWTFKTPPPTLAGAAPKDGPHPLEPLFWLHFDQDVVPSKVIATVKVSNDISVRLASEDEVKAAILGISEEEKKRWVAFKATAPLQPATGYTVSVGPGTPSAEGPLRTESAQTYSFRTYDRLKVEESRCGWGDDCRPLQPFYIRFNNPIDEEKLDPETMVRVEPSLPGLKVEASGSVIWVRGQTKGSTTYTVRLDGSLPDTFGQTLGESESLTFKVGSAQPQLMAPGGQLVTLQAKDKPGFPLYLINYPKLKVKIYAVGPEQWPDFLKALTDQSYNRPFQAPGEKVVDITQETGVQPDELTEVKVALEPALKDGKGMAIVVVEPVTREKYPQRIITWVQVTDLGLDAANDATSLVAYVSKLADGSPVSEAEVSLLGGPRGRTAADGSLELELPSHSCEILVARSGQDATFLPRNVYAWDRSGWSKMLQNDRLIWFVFDDRKMYRPDEEVLVKGWIRRWQAGPKGDIAAAGPGGEARVSWTLYDSRGNEVEKGQTPVSALGGFDLKLKLPKTMNLGTSRLELSTGLAPGGSTAHAFEVQEFRRPEFEVSASAEPETSSIGQGALATVKASYYAGGGLPNAQVDWAVSASQGSFQPPGRDEYTFGTWTPWWDMDFSVRPTADATQTFEGRTDSSGVHRLKLDFASVEPPRPMVVRAEASVQDVNRQAWNASTSVLVHPSDAYVGLKTASTFVEQGKPIELEVLVCDTAGKALTGRPIELRSARIDYEYRKGRYQTVYADRQSFDESSKGDTPSRFSLKTPAGGTYQITVRTYDEKDRPNESQLTVWVPGGRQVPERGVAQEKVVLIPDRKDYQPGDTAQILVQAPFYPAEGVLTLRRSGLLETRRFSLSGPSTVLKVTMESAHVPNLYAQVDLVGKNNREDDTSGKSERPAYATGMLNLAVPPRERTLKVEVLPAQKGLEPGAETHVDVRVTDAKGQIVADSEVALVMVDEAVLALTGYQIANPLDLFYAQRDSGVSDWHSRQYVMLVDLASLSEQAEQRSADGLAGGAVMDAEPPMPSAAAAPAEEMSKAPVARHSKLEAGGGGASQQPPVKVRTNFSALALFAPLVKTKSDGTARVSVKLPDNLTRYRIVAVAVAGANQFGKGESSVVARLPLMVRPSPPRFLNFGDRAELPVVVQNQTDQPLEVQVVVRAQNAVLAEGQGRTFQVKANDRAEVRFPVSTDSAGTASFQVGAFSGEHSDASEFSFPVWTPATTEAFATYGQLDEGATAQPVQAPGEVWKQFGGLELTTTSTALAELTDAMIYLVTYSYGCAEQVSSRVLGIVALQDVLSAFRSEEMPDPAAVRKSVQLDLERLRGMQRPDGGFGFWRPDEEDWPYLSVHVAHTLVRAKLKGHPIPGDMLERSLAYVREVENHIHHWYGLDCRCTIIAYALWVRSLNGDRDVSRARKLVAEAGGVEKLSLEALGFILPILSKEPEAAAIRRHLDNRVTETAEAANFVQDYGESGPHLLLFSDRRVDAILLEALILDSPKSDLIPKLVRGLLGHRTKGRWLNTQENVFVLLAMDRYFNTYEKVTPDFVARVWLGKQYAGEQRFVGRSPDRKGLEVPMSWLAGKGKQDLVLSKEGPGRLYYRIGMRYAPKDLKLDPADHGFTVQRRYEAVDDKEDVTQDAEGVWTVKAGARVRVRLTMVAPNRRYHVALVDPLPAGLEPLNPALKVTGTVPQDPKQRDAIGPYWYWMGTWYEHQNMRDERVEAFTSLLWEGVYDYTYVARATTPGSYVVPPSKAEEMYNPETFGRSGSDRLVVR